MKCIIAILGMICFVTSNSQQQIRRPQYKFAYFGKLGQSVFSDDLSNPRSKLYPGDSGDDFQNQPIDGNCFCVPFYQCQNGAIVTDDTGIIDPGHNPPKEELSLENHFESPPCGPQHVCCKISKTETVHLHERRCGVRNPSGINRAIENKGEADFAEWPWQAAILEASEVNSLLCGGVLIDKRHIATAAHCVCEYKDYDQYPLKVRLGEWDIEKTDEFFVHDDYNVENIHCYPFYRNNNFWNDIAILKLDRDVAFGPHIGSICLPNWDEIFEGRNCITTGWGICANDVDPNSKILKEANTTVMDNVKCQELLTKTRLGHFFKLHDSFICASNEEQFGSCKRCGGNPLVCYRQDGTYVLAGIESWSIDCEDFNAPGVYVRVQKFLDWIMQQIAIYDN